VFISQFWLQLFNLNSTTLKLITAYILIHSQTNDKYNAMNKCIEMYLWKY